MPEKLPLNCAGACGVVGRVFCVCQHDQDGPRAGFANRERKAPAFVLVEVWQVHILQE